MKDNESWRKTEEVEIAWVKSKEPHIICTSSLISVCKFRRIFILIMPPGVYILDVMSIWVIAMLHNKTQDVCVWYKRGSNSLLCRLVLSSADSVKSHGFQITLLPLSLPLRKKTTTKYTVFIRMACYNFFCEILL